MKNKKTRVYDDFEDDENHLKKDIRHRRPIRNWTKAYIDHEAEYDEYDDFHTTRLKS